MQADEPKVESFTPQIDIATAWRNVLGIADPQTIYDTFGWDSKLRADDGQVDAEACRSNAAAIDQSLHANPVGLALWYVAYQCAVALHDDVAAAQRLDMFTQLVRYATAMAPPDIAERPIGILSEIDVWAFVRASGQELLYAYYDPPRIGRYLPMTVSLWDAERKRERILRFDYLDNRIHMVRDQPLAETPAFRYGLAKQFLQLLGTNENSPAAAALTLEKAVGEGDVVKRTIALETSAHGGSYPAAMAYAYLCVVADKGNCATKAVDVLLPWAEKSYASALLMLALAYDQGKGVKRSEDNALALIEKADRRLGDGRGTMLFVSLSALNAQNTKRPSSVGQKSLVHLVAEHNPVAEWLTATFESARTPKELKPGTLEILRHAAADGVPGAQAQLGTYLFQHGEKAQALKWIEQAASANERAAQVALAKAYEQGDGVEKNLDKAEQWYAEAGRSGDANAMLWMAQHYADQPASKQAHVLQEGWLESAMYVGSVPAALDLARLYEYDNDADFAGEKRAAAIYRMLDHSYNNAEARRRLARMLVYAKGVDHDLNEARRLLSFDADKGDLHSLANLGVLMIDGKYGKDEVDQGRKMLEKAAAGDDDGAMVELGYRLADAEKPQREQALVWWRRAAAKGNRVAKNNLAWALCTAPEPNLLDPKQGLEVARALAAEGKAPVAYLDTLAACYAAAADFEQAEKVERDALKLAQEYDPPFEKFVKVASERIELYRKKQPYVEIKNASPE